MKEQSISFETAKLAKEKGINLKEYSSSGIIIDKVNIGSINNDDYDWICKQSLLQKYLREVYNIHLSIWYNNLTEKWRIDYIRNIKIDHSFNVDEFEFETYEQALEAGLLESLNLIKTK